MTQYPVGFGKLQTWEKSPIEPPTWFMYPSWFFRNGIVSVISGNAIKLFGFVLFTQSGPTPLSYETNKEWATHLGMTEEEFNLSVNELIQYGCLRAVYQHCCGALTELEPEDICEKCGSFTLDFTQMMCLPVKNEGRVEVTPLKKKVAAKRKVTTKSTETKVQAKPSKPTARVELADGEIAQVKFTDLVQRMTIATGIQKDLLGSQFWLKWIKARKEMRKRLEDTPYGDVDIQKALREFYAAGYSFEQPQAMVNDLLLAIAGKLQKRFKKDNRPLLYFSSENNNEYETDPEEVTAEEVLAMGSHENYPLEGRYTY